MRHSPPLRDPHLFLALSACGLAAPSILPAAEPGLAAPLAERIEECRHWAGEEPYDTARAREITQAMDLLRCLELERETRGTGCSYKSASRGDDFHREKPCLEGFGARVVPDLLADLVFDGLPAFLKLDDAPDHVFAVERDGQVRPTDAICALSDAGGEWRFAPETCFLPGGTELRSDVRSALLHREHGLSWVRSVDLRQDADAQFYDSPLFYVSASGAVRRTVSQVGDDDKIGPDPFGCGLTRTIEDGRYGFMDSTLSVRIPARWRYASGFEASTCTAWVCQDCHSMSLSNGRHLIVDLQGRPFPRGQGFLVDTAGRISRQPAQSSP